MSPQRCYRENHRKHYKIFTVSYKSKTDEGLTSNGRKKPVTNDIDIFYNHIPFVIASAFLASVRPNDP